MPIMVNIVVAVLFVSVLSGCATHKTASIPYKTINVADGITEAEAQKLAQNALLDSPGNVYRKVDISLPKVDRIDWNDPQNKEMKEKIAGYYQRFQDNWAVRFAPEDYPDPNGRIGCVVWVNKRNGDTQTTCARADL